MSVHSNWPEAQEPYGSPKRPGGSGSRTIVLLIASWSLAIGVLKVAFGLKVRKLATASS